MRTVWQVIAIARTELRFGLRRGWPVIGTVAVGGFIGVFTLSIASANMEGLPHSYAADAGARALGMIWPAFPMLALILLPMVSAVAIPMDRQLGVQELLRSLPMCGGIYLTGKVMGTLAAVLLTGAVVLTLHLILHLALIGPFDPGLYLELTLLSGLPLLLWAPAMGVFGGIASRTRRSSVFAGLLSGVFGLVVWGLFNSPLSPSFQSFVDFNSVAYWSNHIMGHQVISDFVLARHNLLASWISAPTEWHLLMSLSMALILLLLAAALARLWLLQKENF